MRKHTKILALTVVVAAAGWFAGCNGTIDEEPDVVLEVSTLNIPPITSSQNGTGGTCTFTVTAASGTFKNLPKNALAGESPFNDIILQDVSIAYTWDDGAVATPITVGVGGAVPANGSVSAQFAVITNAALGLTQAPDPAGTGRAGHTASLFLTFHGATVSGDAVVATTGASLQVSSCTVNFGACCGAGGTCELLSEAACTTQGGSYRGDGTSCSTSNICLVGP